MRAMGSASASAALLLLSLFAAAAPRPANAALVTKFHPQYAHFVWITKNLEGHSKLEGKYAEHVARFKELNPSFGIQLWDNERVRREMPADLVEFLKAGKLHMHLSSAANLIRYYALAKYGGLYLDVDVYPTRPLDATLLDPLEGKIAAGCAFEEGDPKKEGSHDQYVRAGPYRLDKAEWLRVDAK